MLFVVRLRWLLIVWVKNVVIDSGRNPLLGRIFAVPEQKQAPGLFALMTFMIT